MRDVPLAELLDDERNVLLSEHVYVASRDLLAAEERPWTGPEGWESLKYDPVIERIRDEWTAARRRTEQLGLDRIRTGRLIDVERAQGDADAALARRIGERPMVLTAVCAHLWGTSLTARRDEMVAARVEPGASAASVRALRGRVTRELGAEVERFIEERSGRGARR